MNKFLRYSLSLVLAFVLALRLQEQLLTKY